MLQRFSTAVVLVGTVLAIGCGAWAYYLDEPDFRTPVRIVRGFDLRWPVQPRFSDTYWLLLDAEYDQRMFRAAIFGRDSLLGILFRRPSKADSVAPSGVDLAWTVTLDQRPIANGEAVGRDAGGLGGREAFRECGSFSVRAHEHYLVTIHVRTGNTHLDSLSPHVSLRRSPESRESDSVLIGLGIVAGLLLTVIGATMFAYSIWRRKQFGM
jgi:hypothetical protein